MRAPTKVEKTRAFFRDRQSRGFRPIAKVVREGVSASRGIIVAPPLPISRKKERSGGAAPPYPEVIETLIRAVRGGIVAVMVAQDGRIIQAAPVLARWRGAALTGVVGRLKAEGWTVQVKVGSNPWVEF